MSRNVVVAALVALLAAGGYFGRQAWSARNAPGGDSPSRATATAITDKLRSLASSIGKDDSPVRCRIGTQTQLLRRLDCVQKQGMVLEDGGGSYTKLTKEEMAARSGAPKPQPPAAQAGPAGDAAANAKKAGAVH